MDGAESSSESDMEEDDQSEEEMNIKVHFFKRAYKRKQQPHDGFSLTALPRPCRRRRRSGRGK